MKGLKEMMAAKGKKIDPMAKEAKMGVLNNLKQLATNMMGNDVKGLKKVTVAAPDKQGLAQGLDKAKQLMSGHMGDDESGEDPMEEKSESPAMEHSEDQLDMEMEKVKADPSLENIDALIQMLEAKKAELSGGDQSDHSSHGGMFS